ncbi:hypothetical protein AVEN_72533-1 [Araneus ventricosus]|uniref:Uncharacterized protein n=1 Tax=Araneus ventricosus TaxID=182803 RepID=A0A4Y2KTC0_ARAVE|nr:hypothetical protein AVEN_72533-1 [Araneus ventricosus]
MRKSIASSSKYTAVIFKTHFFNLQEAMVATWRSLRFGLGGFWVQESIPNTNLMNVKCAKTQTTELRKGKNVPYAQFGFESIEKQLWRDKQSERLFFTMHNRHIN